MDARHGQPKLVYTIAVTLKDEGEESAYAGASPCVAIRGKTDLSVQNGTQRLPHRPESGQQNAAAPEGAAALFHQDADAPFRRGDGVADGQLFPGEVVYQLYPGLGGDGFRLHRQHPAQRQRTVRAASSGRGSRM